MPDLHSHPQRPTALIPAAGGGVPRLALTSAEAAQALGRSQRWLFDNTGDQGLKIPYVDAGQKLYAVHQLIAWLDRQAPKAEGGAR